MPIAVIIAVVATLVVAVPSSVLISVRKYKNDSEKKLGEASKRADQIIDEAIKSSEAKKREIMLEAKEESLKTRNELEKEVKERRAEVQKLERRIEDKEEALDKKITAVEQKESRLNAAEAKLREDQVELEELKQKHVKELERISGLTSEQAKQFLLKQVEEDVHHDMAILIKEAENKANDEATKKANEIIVSAVQRCASDFTSEVCVSVVELPNDEMKGRIIGREGRNIRTLENATGVELIVDDTPEAVVLSSFDPVRREVARIALEKLIIDGRIHPARIEEMVEKAEKEVDSKIKDKGNEITLEVGVNGIHPELVRLLGRMYFRTSYGQNALKHSYEVAELSGLIAAEMGENIKLAKRAGLLHDIGKSIDQHVEGSHVQVGADLCRKYKENEVVINAIESHHGDKEATSIISCIVQAADAISAARPGARRESLENYINRLKQLEEIANAYKGVEKSFAIQAGREVRVIVYPDKVNDDDMVIMARDIAKQIEEEMTYPGQVKVNVIRESRATDIAK